MLAGQGRLEGPPLEGEGERRPVRRLGTLIAANRCSCPAWLPLLFAHLLLCPRQHVHFIRCVCGQERPLETGFATLWSQASPGVWERTPTDQGGLG